MNIKNELDLKASEPPWAIIVNPIENCLNDKIRYYS